MRSRDEAPLLDLERDLPTTAEDIAALRKRPSALDGWEAYLHFLASVPCPDHDALRNRRGPRSECMFEL